MPVFKDYQDIPVEMDISVNLFHRSMTPKEKQEMRRLLRTGIGHSTPHVEFETSISKLAENYLSLTPEEIEVLRKMSSRFI
jgi:hypothetical protein